ncbi:MAG: UvrD-helicase domain-containing protein, partial [candidate division WOR-3 bacterium]
MMSVIDKIQEIVPTLNSEQVDAIVSTDGPVLIIAGPGTGKTLTITLRTLYLLLTDKAQPEEIILTTFTEKAAFELKDRVNQLARKLNYRNNLNQLKIGTIHSLCNEFIMKFLNYTPLKKGYIILDELTQLFFIYEHFDEIIPITNGKFFGKWLNKWDTIKNVVSYFNKITEEIIDISLLPSDDFLGEIAESYRKYQEKLFEENKIDFPHLQKIFFDLLQN